jgi:hypothetical protein
LRERNAHFKSNRVERAASFWGKEPVPAEFSQFHNCKDPRQRPTAQINAQLFVASAGATTVVNSLLRDPSATGERPCGNPRGRCEQVVGAPGRDVHRAALVVTPDTLSSPTTLRSANVICSTEGCNEGAYTRADHQSSVRCAHARNQPNHRSRRPCHTVTSVRALGPTRTKEGKIEQPIPLPVSGHRPSGLVDRNGCNGCGILLFGQDAPRCRVPSRVQPDRAQ